MADEKLVLLKECSEGHLKHYRIQGPRFSSEEDALKFLAENGCTGRFFISEVKTFVDLTERKVVDVKKVPVEEALPQTSTTPVPVESVPLSTTDPAGHSVEVMEEEEEPEVLAGVEAAIEDLGKKIGEIPTTSAPVPPVVVHSEIPQREGDPFPELPQVSAAVEPMPPAVSPPPVVPDVPLPAAVEVDLSVPATASVTPAARVRPKLNSPRNW